MTLQSQQLVRSLLSVGIRPNAELLIKSRDLGVSNFNAYCGDLSLKGEMSTVCKARSSCKELSDPFISSVPREHCIKLGV